MRVVTAAAFVLMWASIVASPPLAFLSLPVIRRSRPYAQTIIIIASAIVLCFAVTLLAFRLSLSGAGGNFLLTALSYLAYCFLAASCWHIPRKIVRRIAGIVTVVPICAVYLLGAIGVLTLGWLVSDYGPPDHVEQMTPELVCEITEWGLMAGGPSGYKVHLYKRWPVFPFIEKQVVELTVNQNGPDPDKTCADALQAYTHE